MFFLDLTLPTAAENVALDEALLDAAEAGELPGEVLRLWESPRPVVVIGRSSRIAEEVNIEACRTLGVPILRRASGGAAIVAGPGCLMYAVVLRYERQEHLRMIDQAHRHVLGRLQRALSPLAWGIEHLGTSDLAIRDAAGGPPRKFSGNSLRCKRDHLLYHGTLLYNFDLALVERLLGTPPRQPDYRGGREHGAFVGNLRVEEAKLRQAAIDAFAASEQWDQWPRDRTAKLIVERYGRERWNFER